jgi:hypothetical protein
MFPRRSSLSEALVRGLDRAVEFATLGEYRVGESEACGVAVAPAGVTVGGDVEVQPACAGRPSRRPDRPRGRERQGAVPAGEQVCFGVEPLAG